MTSILSFITQGIWSINAWKQRDAEMRIGAPGTPLIATIIIKDVSINEQKANAILVASSPKLLQMVERLTSNLADHVDAGTVKCDVCRDNVKEANELLTELSASFEELKKKLY